MRRTLLSLLFLSPIALAIYGCGGSAGSFSFFQSGNSGGTNQPAAGPNVPAAALSGKVVFQPVAVVEESERSVMVQYKSLIEVEGVRVSPDGQFVAQPTTPAAGWTARLGAQSVLVNVDGSFAFSSPNGATQGKLIHPSDPTIVYDFAASQLGQAEPLIIPIAFPASCGMQLADTDIFCAPRPKKVQAKALTRPRLVGIDPASLRPAPRLFQDERQLKAGPLGSEPNPIRIPEDPDEERQTLLRCPDTDGKLRFVVPGIDLLKAPRYLFSTCHDFVQTNACLNENVNSDLLRQSNIEDDYLPLLYDQQARTQRILIRNPNLEDARSLHCYQNHKHRNCAQLNIGDVASKLPDNSIIRPSNTAVNLALPPTASAPTGPGFGVVEIGAGETQTITIHNNGAFGITKVNKFLDVAHGTLSGNSIVLREGLPEVRHYEPVDYEGHKHFGDGQDANAYIPDRLIAYKAPDNAQPGQVDSYQFLVDDRFVVVSFQIKANGPFLRRLGSSGEVTVQDLNASGTITTLRDEKTLLEPLGQEPVELLAEPGAALLNDAGHCLYQASDHLSHARLRFPDGQSTELVPPAGSLSNFADAIASLSPQGFYFCQAKRPDGKNDFYTATQGGTVQYLGAPEGLSPSTGVSPLTSTTTDALYCNAPPGVAPDSSAFAGLSNAGKLVKYDFDTRQWSSTEPPPRADFLPGLTSTYVDATASRVLLSTSGNNFSPAQPPAGISWLNFFGFLIQSGAPFVTVHDSRIESASGTRTVIVSEQPIPANGVDSRHTTVALNEEGEAVGMLFRTGNNRPVIYPVTGEPKDLVPLLPPASPAGTWQPLKMAGRYIVLQHDDGAGASSVYLWFRGTE